jgi:hypothetical protein
MLVVVLVLLSLWATDLAPIWSWIRWVAGCTDCGQRLTHDVFFSASLFGRRERLLVSSGTWTSVEEYGLSGRLAGREPHVGRHYVTIGPRGVIGTGVVLLTDASASSERLPQKPIRPVSRSVLLSKKIAVS